MIIGGKILEVEGKKTSGKEANGMELDVRIDNIEVDGEQIEIAYTYTARFQENAGYLTIKGVLLAKEKKELAQEIGREWKKDKKLTPGYSETVIRTIAHGGASNGTLLAMVVDLPAPLIPPRITVGKS